MRDHLYAPPLLHFDFARYTSMLILLPPATHNVSRSSDPTVIPDTRSSAPTKHDCIDACDTLHGETGSGHYIDIQSGARKISDQTFVVVGPV
jgi:hypothetical protein